MRLCIFLPPLQVLQSLNQYLAGKEVLGGAAFEALLQRLENSTQAASAYIRWAGGV